MSMEISTTLSWMTSGVSLSLLRTVSLGSPVSKREDMQDLTFHRLEGPETSGWQAAGTLELLFEQLVPKLSLPAA